MQRLVQVGAGNGDEVLDAARHRPPLVVDHAERGVAVLYRVGNDADRHHVVDLLDGDLLPFHLLVDGVSAFEAALDARRNALTPQLPLNHLADAIQKLLVSLPVGFDSPRDLFECRGIDVAERQVLELAAHLAHTQAVRDRAVDLDGFARDALAPLRLLNETERAHIVEPVRQLHDDDPDIVHHRQQHLAEALGLPLFGREEVELAQLGDAVHAARHVFAEVLAHILDGNAGVLDHVVQ